MGRTAVIPAWVQPAPRQVADAHRIAYALAHRVEFDAVAVTVDWVTGGGAAPITGRAAEPTIDAVHDELAAARSGERDAAVYNTLTWLLGLVTIPPVRLPRRNPDGAVVTADELYAEYTARVSGQPEELRAARARAEKDAGVYRRLADLADSTH